MPVVGRCVQSHSCPYFTNLMGIDLTVSCHQTIPSSLFLPHKSSPYLRQGFECKFTLVEFAKVKTRNRKFSRILKRHAYHVYSWNHFACEPPHVHCTLSSTCCFHRFKHQIHKTCTISVYKMNQLKNSQLCPKWYYECCTFINLLVNIDMLHPPIFRTLFFYIFFDV